MPTQIREYQTAVHAIDGFEPTTLLFNVWDELPRPRPCACPGGAATLFGGGHALSGRRLRLS